jgi:hypothetical protein
MLSLLCVVLLYIPTTHLLIVIRFLKHKENKEIVISSFNNNIIPLYTILLYT